MKAKRMLSLVMAAVLALCVLAGCRGGRALSQVMAGLLEGQYQNVAVEADPDTAARKAFADWDACPPTGSTPLKLPWSRPRAAITSRWTSR